MILQEKAESLIPLGIYVHVPFCARQCDFCAFYQEPPARRDILRYLEGLEQELELQPVPRYAETVFWGGGTPGLLSARDLYRLGSSLLDRLPAAPKEWTVEMAPSTVKADKIRALVDLGVTRISLGVQSFQPRLLEALGRHHHLRQIDRAIETIRSGGVENLNLDLMFALPGQSLEEWEQDLREAIRRAPEHLSTYCLTFEEDTALWVRLRRGAVEAQGVEAEVAFYERSWEILEVEGYHQYEVSNFSRPLRECRHNLNTWEMTEWLGYGPSAASQYEGCRFTNVHSLEEWLRGLEENQPARVEVQPLGPEILAADCLVFGLRMNRGVDLQRLCQRFPMLNLYPVFQMLSNLADEGLLEFRRHRARLTRQGRLVADRVGVEILQTFETADELFAGPDPRSRAFLSSVATPADETA